MPLDLWPQVGFPTLYFRYQFTHSVTGMTTVYLLPRARLAWETYYPVHTKSFQLYLTLCDLLDCSLPGSLCPWDSPGKNTGVGCHALIQGNLPNPGIEFRSHALQADSLLYEPQRKPIKVLVFFFFLFLFFFLILFYF